MAENHQIIVIGAGAEEMGASVLLLEKMERPGKKKLIAGNGRCNLSNSLDMDSFITHFGLSGPMALEMSLAIVDALENGPVSISIDLMPEKDGDTLRTLLGLEVYPV